MAFKRKPWGQLSEPYRKRLERHGITAESHQAGTGLHRARGKPLSKLLGHRPDRAIIRPDRSDLVRQLAQRKRRWFGDEVKYSEYRSANLGKFTTSQLARANAVTDKYEWERIASEESLAGLKESPFYYH